MSTTPPIDPALRAIRDALEAAGNNPAEILVERVDNREGWVIVRYDPQKSDALHEPAWKHAAYAKDLIEAGWKALDLDQAVVVGDIPPADASPDSFTAT